MGVDALLGAVPVVVEKLRARLDLDLGHQDEARLPQLEVHDLGLEVGTHAGVVDQAAEARRLFRRVNAVKEKKLFQVKGVCVSTRL